MIKKYKQEFLDIKWHFKVSSTIINDNSLTERQIKSALYSITDPIQVAWDLERYNENIKEYVGTIAEWQFDKGEEIKKKIIDNIYLTVNNKYITVTIQFDICFPSDWKRWSVLEWCEGFNRLNCCYLFVASENYCAIGTRDREIHNNIMSFFKKLQTKQKFTIKKIK